MNKFILFFLFFYSINLNLQSQWTQIGPIGGTVYSVAATGPNIFVGTDGGAFKSTDNGETWLETTLKYYNAGMVYALFIDETRIFAGAGTLGRGINLSTDNGQTWNNVLTNQFINCFVKKDSKYFAGTCTSGVLVSSDNGQTWNQTNLTVFNIQSISVSDSLIFAGTFGHGIFSSSDNGINWNQVPLYNNNLLIYSLYVDGPKIFAGTNDNILYFSSNYGSIWIQSLTGHAVYAIAVNGETIFAGTHEGIFISSDYGKTWNQSSINNQLIGSILGPFHQIRGAGLASHGLQGGCDSERSSAARTARGRQS